MHFTLLKNILKNKKIVKKIPFNKPYLTGEELDFIGQALETRKISGDGQFTNNCHKFFMSKYGFKRVLMTTSCTDALEMSAILSNIKSGDEVIIPSFTFVSTANAFALRGAKIIFADSTEENPNVDAKEIEKLITKKTKAIVPVHYAGIACEMDSIREIARSKNIFLIEDAAQAINSYYKGKPLGSLGDLGTLSFHETKNIICGEGGLLIINKEELIERAEIIREKGTDRSKFYRGEVDKYNWKDIGSSFLPSEINAAFLSAQLNNIENIQNKRNYIWETYYNELLIESEKCNIKLPFIPKYATNNSHMFYMVCNNIEQRNQIISELKNNSINAVFHYQSLHNSPYFKDKHDGRELKKADLYSNCLVRLPLYFELEQQDLERIIDNLKIIFRKF